MPASCPSTIGRAAWPGRLQTWRGAKSEELEATADSAWPSVYEEMEETLLEVAGRVENLTRGLAQVIPE